MNGNSFFHELQSPLYVRTPAGGGWAIFVSRSAYDGHLVWSVVMDDGGGVEEFENPNIRMDKVATLGRTADPNFVKTREPFKVKP